MNHKGSQYLLLRGNDGAICILHQKTFAVVELGCLLDGAETSKVCPLCLEEAGFEEAVAVEERQDECIFCKEAPKGQCNSCHNPVCDDHSEGGLCLMCTGNLDEAMRAWAAC